MSRFLAILSSFAASAVLLAGMLSAQEKDKDEKKDDEPKPEVKKIVIEEKPVHGAVLTAKITKMSAESQRDFSIAQYVLDPAKQAQFNQWYQSQMRGISGPQGAQNMFKFKQEYARKMADPNTLYAMKDLDLRAVEACKIRSMNPPFEYDDKGNLKKWTAKELAVLKGNSKLPGYPTDMDALKPGTFVTVYLAKQAPMPKGTKIAPKVAPKKNLDDDVVPDMTVRAEVVMIVIMGDSGPGKN